MESASQFLKCKSTFLSGNRRAFTDCRLPPCLHHWTMEIAAVILPDNFIRWLLLCQNLVPIFITCLENTTKKTKHGRKVKQKNLHVYHVSGQTRQSSKF